jgi:hypothetical protein
VGRRRTRKLIGRRDGDYVEKEVTKINNEKDEMEIMTKKEKKVILINKKEED